MTATIEDLEKTTGSGFDVGIWDVDDVGYFDDTTCISNSMLKTFIESVPRYHAKYVAKTITDEPSDSLRLGQAFHAIVLQPEKNLVAVSPKFDRRTKQGKADACVFAADHASKIIVDSEEAALLEGMVAGIQANPTTRRIVAEGGHREIPVRWVHQGTGLPCKSRFDLITSELIVDVKTIDSLANWPKHVVNFAYHRQAAFYLQADACIQANFGHKIDRHFVFVVVEKEPPHEAAAFTLDSRTLALAHGEIDAAMAELKFFRKLNIWKSRYHNQIIPTVLPAWALKGA